MVSEIAMMASSAAAAAWVVFFLLVLVPEEEIGGDFRLTVEAGMGGWRDWLHGWLDGS